MLLIAKRLDRARPGAKRYKFASSAQNNARKTIEDFPTSQTRYHPEYALIIGKIAIAFEHLCLARYCHASSDFSNGAKKSTHPSIPSVEKRNGCKRLPNGYRLLVILSRLFSE
ncbi:hypothetical protein AFLA_014041 [Aspergillus flavus NRRL3357]|nr:hypothetical protein AFLA_014041 [Aspergillus flavus NRRL3357]